MQVGLGGSEPGSRAAAAARAVARLGRCGDAMLPLAGQAVLLLCGWSRNYGHSTVHDNESITESILWIGVARLLLQGPHYCYTV